MPIWKLPAVTDRKAIAKYISRDNPVAAVELVDLLIDKAVMLDENPKIGRPGRMKGTREWLIYPHYVIVYHLTGKPLRVEILRVKHTAQQWPPTKKIG